MNTGHGTRGIRLIGGLIVLAGLAAGVHPAGAAWFDESRLTHDDATSYMPPNNSWAVAGDDAGNVHVVWFDMRDGNAEIYYKRFDGSAWTPDERLTFDDATSGDPSVAAYGDGVVHVVWHDLRDGNFEIYHKVYDGTVWSPDERLTYANNTSWNPSVAVGPDSSVHVVWHDTRDGFTEIYYKKYDGVSWGPDIRLTVAAYVSQNPSVAVDDAGNVHVVWNDFRYYTSKVYYKKFDGVSWGPDIRLTDEDGLAQAPCIAAGPGGKLHVVTEDYRDGNYEIYYKEFDGSTWSPDQRLTEDAAVSGSPNIAAGPDGRLHVVWHDRRTPNFQIYYKCYNGSSWEPDFQITLEAGDSKFPSIAVAADSILHAVWQDRRDGNYEIYWTRTYRTVHVDSLAGANFLFEVDVRLRMEGESDVAASNIVVHSSELITCDFNLWEASVGSWDVVLDNPDGKSDTLFEAFRVLGLGDLEVYSISPDSGIWGGVVHIDSIIGNGFNDSTAVRLEISGQPDLIAGNVEVFAPTRITCDFDLSVAYPGYWDLIAANPDGQADTIAAAFEVVGLSKPVIYYIVPDYGKGGESVHISDLSGAHFSAPARVLLAKASEADVEAVNVTVESPERITCDIALPLGASGSWDVIVKNPDAQADTLAAAFEIFPGPWSADLVLCTGASDARLSRPNGRCLAVDPADNVHVVWYDYRNGSAEIYYRRFDGTTWGPEKRLTKSLSGAECPSIAADPAGNIHVVWTDFRDGNWEIYYKMYDGVSWGPDTRLTVAEDDSRMPAIAADRAGNLHVVWYDARYSEWWDVFYKKYDGAWSADTMISNSGASAYSALPAVAVDEDFNVHTAWYDSRYGADEILYRKFNGSIWEPEVRISDAWGDSWSPSIATVGQRVYIAWHDGRYGGYEIMLREFNGAAWGPEQRVTHADGVSGNSCLAPDDSGYVHLVWHDNRDGNTEIYYKRFNGATWTADLRLTAAPLESQRPFIASDAKGRLHVVWQDRRLGYYAIYYKSKDPSSMASVRPEDTVEATHLAVRVMPNPLNGNGLIEFSLPAAARARLAVYDIAGRAVWDMDLGEEAAGSHRIEWPGCDRDGRPVSTGVYFIKVISPAGTSTAKVVVLR
jgi:hypothetical protein